MEERKLCRSYLDGLIEELKLKPLSNQTFNEVVNLLLPHFLTCSLENLIWLEYIPEFNAFIQDQQYQQLKSKLQIEISKLHQTCCLNPNKILLIIQGSYPKTMLNYLKFQEAILRCLGVYYSS